MSMPCVFCEQAAPSVACDMHTSHADIIPLRSTGRSGEARLTRSVAKYRACRLLFVCFSDSCGFGDSATFSQLIENSANLAENSAVFSQAG